VRDYLFGADGRFVTSMPTGWAWGPAELDRRRFIIVRTDSPEWEAARLGLEKRKKILDKPGLWASGNVYAAGSLKAAPEAEHLAEASWTNLRTGVKHRSEKAAMEDTVSGDVLFYVKSNDPNCPGVAIKVFSAARGSAALQKGVTIEEAQRWLS